MMAVANQGGQLLMNKEWLPPPPERPATAGGQRVAAGSGPFATSTPTLTSAQKGTGGGGGGVDKDKNKIDDEDDDAEEEGEEEGVEVGKKQLNAEQQLRKRQQSHPSPASNYYTPVQPSANGGMGLKDSLGDHDGDVAAPPAAGTGAGTGAITILSNRPPQSESLKQAANELAAANALAFSSTPALDDFSHLPPTEQEAAKKARLRQMQREREFHSRNRLKAYVALNDFDGYATTDFYGFGKVLGQGSFGEVRLAWHRLAGAKVAIKSYEKSKLLEANHAHRVREEIWLMERLNHPHVIRELETFESPRRVHIVMEYVAGGNLCKYVKDKGRLSEAEARVLFLQLVSGVEYLHDCGIIHRDIKCVEIVVG